MRAVRLGLAPPDAAPLGGPLAVNVRPLDALAQGVLGLDGAGFDGPEGDDLARRVAAGRGLAALAAQAFVVCRPSAERKAALAAMGA